MEDDSPTQGSRGIDLGVRPCAIIPAYRASKSIASVVEQTCALWPEPSAVFVVDDGSDDGTAALAREAGAYVLQHSQNRGKGTALRTGFAYAERRGFDVAVTLDADAQHPPKEALRLAMVEPDPGALVLGVRDLVVASAPRSSQFSNRISNYWLSLFTERPLADTQCGLRRYPISTTLALGGRDPGYAYEAEIILRAIAAGVRVVEVPIEVYYPPAEERVSHFHVVRDPARIIKRVLLTLASTRLYPTTIPGSSSAPKQ